MPKAHARYLKILLGSVAATAALLAAVNATVDPLGLFDSPAVEGFNRHKPAFFAQLRLAKPAAVRRIRPTSLILGSSTAEVGLDPLHPAWRGERVYNFGVSGAIILEAERYLRFAQRAQPLRRVVLLLDLFMFNVHYRRGREAELDAELATGAGATFDRLAGGLFSAQSLEASWDTVVYNRQNVGRQDAVLYLPQGQHPPLFLEHQLARGQRAAFVRCEEDYINRIFTPPPARKFAFAAPRADGSTENVFDSFRSVVEFCGAEQIELICVISPCHARMNEAIAVAGLWQQYESWKRTLTEIVAARGPGAEACLWDFSGYNFATTEDVPAEGDTAARMQWYWESIHFRKELGDLVLARVLDADGAGSVPEFGVRLSPQTIEGHLAEVRTQRAQYVAAHRDDEEIAALRRPAEPVPGLRR